ncbi:MAG: sulfite exporter TauE/SafE family protein [Sedimentisphaerales bacterium]|nr:sulfite exporter TauE/SafE family protein [Sedimentisphaerales bacterium]
MNNLFIASASALWLGILTSISPCPMATNIAAISFIGRRIDKPGYVLCTGILYTIGRTVTYIVLGVLLVGSLLSMPVVSHWLQKYMHKILGPILILVAMMLLDMMPLSTKGSNVGQWCQQRAEKFGLGGALFLGFVFALSFCPVSAALFFGSLIPLSVKHSSGIILPLVYGIGTALPVFVFGLLVSFSAGAMAKVFHKVSQFELWARRITGAVFLVIGVYFTLIYTVGITAVPL